MSSMLLLFVLLLMFILFLYTCMFITRHCGWVAINFIHPNLLAPTAGLLQSFAKGHAAVSLPDNVQECLWTQEATGKACVGLMQNIVDTAVNE